MIGAVVVAAIVSTGAAAAQQGADAAFVADSATSGITEVELAKLAQQRSGNAQVRQFAQKMIDDHTAANAKLAALARLKGMTVPAALTGKGKAAHDKLSRLAGPPFDRSFMDVMVSDHNKAVADFSREAERGQDAEIKGFAAETVPTLREHLTHAKELKSIVNQRPATGNDSATR